MKRVFIKYYAPGVVFANINTYDLKTDPILIKSNGLMLMLKQAQILKHI